MATFSKILLSGSTNGRPIEVAATTTVGTLIHTTGAGIDEIWLFANNTSVTAEKLTIEFGGVTDADDLIEVTIEPEDGLVIIIPGLILNGTSTIGAFAGTTNVINVSGFVNRIA